MPSIVIAGFSEMKGLARALEAIESRAVTGRSGVELAQDEDFWFEIQQAFAVDRTIVNLNNGGVSPAPSAVTGAMQRYLDYSNLAPVCCSTYIPHTCGFVPAPGVISFRGFALLAAIMS